MLNRFDVQKIEDDLMLHLEKCAMAVKVVEIGIAMDWSGVSSLGSQTQEMLVQPQERKKGSQMYDNAWIFYVLDQLHPDSNSKVSIEALRDTNLR